MVNQSSLSEQHSPKPSDSIPGIVHHILGAKTNEVIDRCLLSWRDQLGNDFEFNIWDDSKLSEFIFRYYRFAYDAFINARNHAEAADIGRYLVVYHFGGYYVDWDVELLDKQGFIYLSFKYPTGYMLCDPCNQTLASEYFCASAGDPYLLNLSLDIAQLYQSRERENLFTPSYSGPFRMRDSLAKHPNTNMKSIPVKEVFAYDYSEIRNPPSGEITAPLLHYWLHTWIS
ncbi:hypothetical protein ASE74_10095 [Pedobacter sp. Leaf216]|uniref:glycosyltransferase n=1 Tax=Pedobacter sp. Leaf216 TaxID=1735684 RepID=UPI00070174EB|nr:glycosyltransferase [Pedobacter sp. Leaf216]KQM65212.1 hypothetical protein ASE74_10095 [Pedobacter sp. Leaf216]